MIKSEPPISSLLETMAVAAYTCDPDGHITYFNRAAAEVWGREPRLNNTEDRYCGSAALFWSDGKPMSHDQCWMARALQEGREYNGCEVIIERPDGQRVQALAYANPILDEAGHLNSAVNILVRVDQKPAGGWKPVSPPLRVLLIATQRETMNLASLLTAMGHDVKTATGGLEAIQIARKFHPGVIFIETELPQMDGYEVARMLRRAPWGHHIVLIAVNSSDPKNAKAAQTAGFDHQLQKQLNVAAVLPILESIVRR